MSFNRLRLYDGTSIKVLNTFIQNSTSSTNKLDQTTKASFEPFNPQLRVKNLCKWFQIYPNSNIVN